MSEGKRIGFITCVGMHALAAVTPLQTWLAAFPEASKLEVTLLHTPKSLDEAKKIGTWFEILHPDIPVRISVYTAAPSAVAEICREYDRVYYLVNPGMSHQIALMALGLPENTVCLASDDAFLYEWPLMEDIRTAKKSALSNVGVNIVSQFLRDHRFEFTLGENRQTLAPGVKSAMDKMRNPGSWTLRFIGKRAQTTTADDDMIRVISERIVWVTESTGRLFVLFDLTKDAAGARGEREAKAWLLSTYRAIYAESDNLYIPVVITDRLPLIERAKIDRVDYVDLKDSRTPIHRVILDFEAGRKLPKPKQAVPDSVRWQLGKTTPRKQDQIPIPEGKRVLLFCIGDNLVPTLKALLSTPADTFVLFFDRNAPYIAWCAERIRAVFGHLDIRLAGTDHMGAGILDWIRERGDGWESESNVTPGTKPEALALAVAARRANRPEAVTSLLRTRTEGVSVDSVVRVLDGGKVRPSKEPTLAEQMDCQIPPRQSEGDRLYKIDLWSRILSGLAKGRISSVPAHYLMKLRGKDFSIKRLKDVQDSVVVNFGKDQSAEYMLSPPFFDEKQTAGIWWEATVASVFDRCGFVDEMFWQYTLGWPGGASDKSAFLSEVDVVCRVGGEIIVVSCKARREMKVEEWTASLMAEARLRFGRLPLCFLAVPFERDSKGRPLDRLEVGKVDMLTPRTLASPEKLKEAVDRLRGRLRTTS